MTRGRGRERVMVFEISHVIHFKRKEVTIHKERHVPTDGAVCAVSITQIKRASVTNRGFEIRGGFCFLVLAPDMRIGVGLVL